MGSQDKSLRQVAIPYYGQIMGYNRAEQSDQDISLAQIVLGAGVALAGDLYPFTYSSGQKDFMVRILRPQFGQLIEAYLNLSLTFDTMEISPKFYVSAGSGYGADGVTPVVPSQSYIQQVHQVITGQTSPLTGIAGQPMTQYKLNILPLLPLAPGSTNFSPDSFVVGIHFLQIPVMTGLFHLQKFFVTGSALVIP